MSKIPKRPPRITSEPSGSYESGLAVVRLLSSVKAKLAPHLRNEELIQIDI